VLVNCGGGKFKSQLKRADLSGANVALIIGEYEAARQEVIIKPLRSGAEQFTVSLDRIAAELAPFIKD
jgi:histidyl-tRNA synthetase